VTMALCFHCGQTKFGEICPCPDCRVSSTGNIQLDIAFSDHHLSVATIGAFGEVVRALRRVCPDDKDRFWAFIHYVSTNHPDILHIESPAEEGVRLAQIATLANPPPVVIEESERARFMRELEERDANAPPAEE
jgi:hypothetical protein